MYKYSTFAIFYKHFFVFSPVSFFLPPHEWILGFSYGKLLSVSCMFVSTGVVHVISWPRLHIRSNALEGGEESGSV